MTPAQLAATKRGSQRCVGVSCPPVPTVDRVWRNSYAFPPGVTFLATPPCFQNHLSDNDMGRIERTREIARKRSRRVKLKKLRAKFALAKTETEKAALRDKAFKVSPQATLD